MQTWNNIKAISLITIKEALRLNLLRAILVLVVLLSMINIFVANLFSWDLGKVSVEFGLSASALIGLILVFYLGMKIFTEDLDNHSIYLVMARPVKYWHYITGKYLGLGSVLFLVISIFSIGAAISMKYFMIYYAGFVPPDFSWPIFMLAFFFQWLSLLVVLAMTFFWFSFAQQPFVALILSIMSYLVGQNLELLRQYVLRGDLSTLDLQQMAVIVISWLFPNLSFFDLKFTAAYGLPIDPQKLLFVVLYGICCTVISLSLSTFFFSRKELP